MKFSEIVKQTVTLLRESQRITYRALKREFSLDEEALEDLKSELIKAKRLAVDEDGEVLVWVGEQPVVGAQSLVASLQPPAPNTQPPISYTPSHLADRIRATTVTDGERKTITALFADLKGSTALIEGLDPEEARAIIDPALQLMMDAVHRYEGYVAQALGDGIFALFGAPIAHEDHPQRALYAALRMQEEMRRYGDTLRIKGYPPLAMRVGINTGEVVVRSIRKDDLHTDYVPIGHSTNLAARMEQLAAPGAILITAYTHRLTEGYFAFKDLGKTQIKGVEEPLTVYEVLGAGPLRTRLQVMATQRGLTRFIGRQREMEQLHTALAHVTAGHGQIVGVMGEPGLGKSRLFYEFKLFAPAGCLLLEAYSVSHGKASPYLPVIELLKSYFRIELTDVERTRRQKVIGKVLELDRSLEDALPYLFALLGIDDQASSLHQMDPQIRRRRTFDALKRLFLRESLNQPLILVFEDLHWIDSETQGFLDTLSESIASAKILLLVNYRPEYRHEWSQKSYYTQLRLAPFGRAEAEEFFAVLLGHDGSLSALKQQILTKTEGTPFFMEEVVQTLVEDGTLAGERGHYTLPQPQATFQLPTTVQGVLTARIDRLSAEEKELLQHLAVIGREFPLRLVRQVVSQPEADLYRLLSSLQHKEFLFEQPAFPDVTYLFKHALTQDVAYHSVLLERRKVLHEQTGHTIEQLYHERLEEHYDELAHHYQRSGNAEKAITYLYKAGQRTVQRSAHADAVTLFTAALELLSLLPAGPDRTHRELTLHLALGVTRQATNGFGSPEVGQAYERAYALCQEIGEVPELFPIMRGLCVYHNVQANFHQGHALAQQLLAVAEQAEHAGFRIEAHLAMGGNIYWQGDFTGARAQFDAALALYNPFHHRHHTFVYGRDSRMFGLEYAARTLWSLGYPDQALQHAHDAVRWAQELEHAHSLVWALTDGLLWVRLYRQEWREAHEQIESTLAVATDYGFSVWIALATVMRGWLLLQQGQLQAGLEEVHHGLSRLRATGTRTFEPLAHALLIEAYGKTGEVERGCQAVSEALQFIDRYDNRFLEAEIYRLKGELTLQQESKEQRAESKEHEAEACFLKAIDIAQKQQAKSLELRAAMSLARLWQQQAAQSASRPTQHDSRTRLAEAHQMLSTIYKWFTEGFDTKDLQEAKALLKQLRDEVAGEVGDGSVQEQRK